MLVTGLVGGSRQNGTSTVQMEGAMHIYIIQLIIQSVQQKIVYRYSSTRWYKVLTVSRTRLLLLYVLPA